MANGSGFPISKHDTESSRWTTIPFRNQMTNFVVLYVDSAVVSTFASFTQEGIDAAGSFGVVNAVAVACE